ncbi:MAG: IS5 family transposase [Leptolyngbyaceae cyanobacterium]
MSGLLERAIAHAPGNEHAMIDSTMVSVHQHRAGAKGRYADGKAIGRSKGRSSTKIYALTDALGNPLAFHLSPGQACNLDGSDVLLEELEAKRLLANKGDDADERVIQRLEQVDKKPVIPPKRNRCEPRKYDSELYKAQHLIENFFARLKQSWAIATRYDMLAESFLGAIYLAATVV